MTDISVTNVEKTYSNDVTALNSVSIEIESGDFYGLIGENGAGKTSLINVLTGQIEPDGGEVDVLGVDPTEDEAEARAKVGILPEKESPLSFLTPREYFEFVGDVRGIDQKILDKRVETWSERLELTDKLDSLNRNLSRGQQQKVMFAATFLHEPDLVFIDEPLVNLDPGVQARLKKYLAEYNENGNTIVFSTHYLEAAKELCTKIGIMKKGELIGEYDVDELETHEELRDVLVEGGEAQ